MSYCPRVENSDLDFKRFLHEGGTYAALGLEAHDPRRSESPERP